MPVERVSHVGICVADLDRSRRFYRDLLGFEEVGQLRIGGEPTTTLLRLSEVDLEAVFLERDGLRVELLHFVTPGSEPGDSERRPVNATGLTHLSLRVSDLASLLDRFRAEGVRVLDDTRIDIPAVEAAAVFVVDPDGTKIELVQAPGDPAAPPDG